MGMTWEQYWDGDVWMAQDFRKAHKMKLEAENRNAYIHGMYTYAAIASMVPVLRPFSKAKKPEDYLTEPLDLYGKEVKPKQESKEEKTMNTARTLFEVWAVNFNDKFDEREKNEGKEVKHG